MPDALTRMGGGTAAERLFEVLLALRAGCCCEQPRALAAAPLEEMAHSLGLTRPPPASLRPAG